MQFMCAICYQDVAGVHEVNECVLCSYGGLLHLNADDLVKLLSPERDVPLVAAVDVVGSQLRQTIRTFI